MIISPPIQSLLTQAYKENMLNFIFRFDALDIGAVARAYGLLR